MNTLNYVTLSEKKAQLDKLRPFPKSLILNLEEWFRVELTYTSNAIEGNTLTRKETALVIEKGLTVRGKPLKEHLEATNHAKALDWVKNFASKSTKSITENDILSLHQMILRGIDDENAGIYRNVSVRISGSRVILPNPLKLPILMAEFIDGLKTSHPLHPAKLAGMAHYQLVTIHPFVDGNGRTARLLMNLILLQQGYPPAIIRIQDRLAYINSLEKAPLGGSIADYEKLIVQAVNQSLDIYLKALQKEVSPKTAPLKSLFKPSLKEMPSLLRIGSLAKQTHETLSTLRYWTKLGLITPIDHTDSGYTLYAFDTLARVKRIRQLQRERYSLQEIKDKLGS